MKKRARKFLAMALAAIMSLSVSAPVFAAEVAPDDADQPVAVVAEVAADEDGGNEGIELYGGTTSNLTISNHYRTVIDTKKTPIEMLDYKVTSSGYNGWVYRIDILCFNSDGSVAKEFHDASGVMASGTLKIQQEFKLMNVTRIDVLISPRLGVTPELGYDMKFTWR